MKNLLKIEFMKSLKNKYFVFSVVFGFLVTILSFLYNYELYTTAVKDTELANNTFGIIYNPMNGMNTLYNSWVGGEAYTIGTTVFFFIFPILITTTFYKISCSQYKFFYEFITFNNFFLFIHNFTLN